MSTIVEFIGEVTRERWRPRDAEQDFVIAEAQSDEQTDAVAVLGNAPRGEFVPGLTYRFLGKWDEDRKDKFTGRIERQFKFAQFVKAEPHSRYGLVAYLEKYAPGIGPVTAGRLFDEFGSDAVKVLREFPAKAVTAVNGTGGRVWLTLEKAEAAAVVLRSMGKLEDTKIELTGLFHGRGFPHTLIDQCLRVWGVLAPQRIARDPFSLLVRRLSGCGFARCDRLYNDLGLPPGRLKRQLLCLWNALRGDNAGHTWFPAEQCKQLLEQSVSGCRVNFARAVQLGLRSRWLARYRDAAGKMWLAEFSKAENERIVAERLAELLNDPVSLTAFTATMKHISAEEMIRLDNIQDATADDTDDTSQEWRFSSKSMTVWVREQDGIIIDAAPIVQKFVDQPLSNLETWMSRQGKFKKYRIANRQVTGDAIDGWIAVAETEAQRIERFIRVGRETGICQFCNRALTDPISVYLGYGPICSQKFNLPWGRDLVPARTLGCGKEITR